MKPAEGGQATSSAATGVKRYFTRRSEGKETKAGTYTRAPIGRATMLVTGRHYAVVSYPAVALQPELSSFAKRRTHAFLPAACTGPSAQRPRLRMTSVVVKQAAEQLRRIPHIPGFKRRLQSLLQRRRVEITDAGAETEVFTYENRTL